MGSSSPSADQDIWKPLRGKLAHGEKPQDGVQPRAIPSNNSAILVKRGVAPTDRVTKDTMRSRERVSSGANFIFAFSDAMG